MSRPEHLAPPEIFYDNNEARKYTSKYDQMVGGCPADRLTRDAVFDTRLCSFSTRIIEIQGRMTERAIELLCLPEDTSSFVLDLGCGSGLSGQVLEEAGHCWVGVDISEAMLDVAVERKQEEDISSCDFLLGDLGQGLPFRAGSFDGAISISALQWLCNADKSSHRPVQRLLTLFTSLYSCLTRGSRAVLQFYPENADQIELVTNQAMKAGFSGGVVVDFPNSAKAKKMFLVLFTGGENTKLPKGLEEESSHTVKYTDERRERMRNMRGKPPKKSREWILEKKARKRRQGHEVRPDSKYTGRKRSGRF